MVERTLISFPSQLQLIERLQHLLYLSSSMVFISGEQGSGKSTLIEQLSNQLPDNTQQAFIRLAEPISEAQIRQKIISQFFEQPLFDADDSLLNSLILLKKKQKSDVDRVIVIDNAQLLPETLQFEIAEIIKKKSVITDNEINVILLSDESNNKVIVNTIKHCADMRDIATLSFKLSPLSVGEAKQLLNHRFAQLGYSPQVEHQDALLKQLSRCQGIPEKILLLATELNSGELEDIKASWFKTRFPAILLMLILVVVASSLAFYLYPLLIKNKAEAVIIIETEEVLLEELPLQELNTEGVSVASATEALAGQWSNNKQGVMDNQLSVGEADKKQRVTISETQLLNIAPLEELQTSPEIEQVLVDQIATVKPLKVESPSEPQEPTMLIVEPVTMVTQSQATATVIADENTDIKTESAEVKESVEVQVLEIEPLAKTDLFTPTATLVAINPNNYTLQLSAMGTKKSLKEFIQQHKLPRKNVYLYQTVRNQKPLYMVIYGQFESRQDANRVAANLPTTLKTLDSWVKKYSSVHQDLQLNE